MNWEAWFQAGLAASIIIGLILIVWAKVMNQSIYDCVMELKDIVKGLAGK